MRPIKRLIQLDEALALALRYVQPIKRTELVPISLASCRVAAEDVISSLSVPPFDRAAMDGYAVRAADTYGASELRPVRLKRVEVVPAGAVPRKRIGKGLCAEVATGAMLPRGADAVVMVEDTELDGDTVIVSESVHPGKNVSKKGEDIAPGTKVIRKGELLNPSKIGALAAIGVESVRVYSKPLVAVVPTGDEIAPLGSKLKPGQVYNVNGYTLSSALAGYGAEPRVLPIVSDCLDSLEKVVEENRDCEMLIFSGGSSVGARDMMLDLLDRLGKVVFHGIAVKPGKPTLFGTIGRQLVFGMPGYPTSCLSNAYLLLAPVVRKLARLPAPPERTVEARMGKRVVSTTGRTQFLPVRLEEGVVQPAFKESGAITSMAFADGYVLIPADVDFIEKGELVTVHLL